MKKKKIVKLVMMMTIVLMLTGVSVPYISQQSVQAASINKQVSKVYKKILKKESKKDENLSYSYVDINRDGKKELLVISNGSMLTKICTYVKGKVKVYKSSSYYGEAIFEGDVMYNKQAKKLIVYLGGTSSAYSGFQIKNGKLVISRAFEVEKVWKKDGSYKLNYYVNGKKVSQKKYEKKMKTYKAIKKYSWN